MASDQAIYNFILLVSYLISPATFISTLFTPVPYGKHRHPGNGRTMPAPLAWFLMESPTLWFTLLIFLFGQHRSNPKALILILPFLIHYFNRTILYPIQLLRRQSGNKLRSDFPVFVTVVSFWYNMMNSYVQVRWVSNYKDCEGDDWFWWKLVCGSVLFFGGMLVNVKSDKVLLRLKKESGGGYKVPRGGWFELVSCPNYFGEIVEWVGWAILTWSWAGLGFSISTCANLVPRAIAYHKWYLDKFGEDYPKGRKAVIPFLF